jgi:hypothetical protein
MASMALILTRRNSPFSHRFRDGDDGVMAFGFLATEGEGNVSLMSRRNLPPFDCTYTEVRRLTRRRTNRGPPGDLSLDMGPPPIHRSNSDPSLEQKSPPSEAVDWGRLLGSLPSESMSWAASPRTDAAVPEVRTADLRPPSLLASLRLSHPTSFSLLIHHFPSLSISAARAALDLPDRVARQSEWHSMIDIEASPSRGRSPSPNRPLLRCRSRQMPESDQFVEYKA